MLLALASEEGLFASLLFVRMAAKVPLLYSTHLSRGMKYSSSLHLIAPRLVEELIVSEVGLVGHYFRD